jgi:hypothetical protein
MSSILGGGIHSGGNQSFVTLYSLLIDHSAILHLFQHLVHRSQLGEESARGLPDRTDVAVVDAVVDSVPSPMVATLRCGNILDFRD